MVEKLTFYIRHSMNDLRVNGRRTFFGLLCIAAGVAGCAAPVLPVAMPEPVAATSDGAVDFYGAVQARDDETVLFSWLEYPDKATRDAANDRMMNDPRMADMPEMPFDGTRMIWSGFEVLLDVGPGGKPGYVDGVVLPVITPADWTHLPKSWLENRHRAAPAAAVSGNNA